MRQRTLMSPRYSNVTTSIRELIIRYASNNFTFIIFNPHKELQRAPQSFHQRKEDENVQPTPMPRLPQGHGNPRVDHQNIHQVTQ